MRSLPEIPVFAGIAFGLFLMIHPEWFGLPPHGAGKTDHATQPPFYIFPLVFIAILWSALRASEHAEAVAIKLPDPFGTLVLTLSAVFIEVALVIGVMMTGSASDTVARDTMFATLMLIMNGLVGLSLIAGALRKREQPFNAQSSSSYLGVTAALCTIGLVLPRFTTSEPGGYMSARMDIFVAGGSLIVYSAFIFLQSSSHRDFFVVTRQDAQTHVSHSDLKNQPLWKSISFLIVALLSVVLLSESLGDLLVGFLARNELAPALQGVVIAFLVLLPEGIAAVRSALRSDVQRSINILHGSALSTIGLTIPAVLFVAMLFGKRVELGLEPPEICILAATMILSMLHFGAGKTNMMQGIVHAMLFVIWIALLIDPQSHLPAVP